MKRNKSERGFAAISKDAFVTWEMKQLYRAAKKLGFQWMVLDPRHTSFDVTHRTLLSRTIKGLRPQGFFGRLDMDCMPDGVRLLNLLKQANLPVMNDGDAFMSGRDKSMTALAMQRASLSHPTTTLLAHRDVERVGKHLDYPLVVKPVTGSGGEQVELITSPTHLKSLTKDRFPLLVQEYCSPIRTDLRVMVVCDKVLGGVRRIPVPGEWRSNARLGATITKADLSPTIQEIAWKATRAIGADVAGVDLIETVESTFVIEVNVCPGFHHFSKVTHIDVAKEIVCSLASLSNEEEAGSTEVTPK